MNGGTNSTNKTIYSPDERRIGWWEYYDNGVKYRKPLYEKTVTISSPTIKSGANVLAVTSDIIDNFEFGFLVNAWQKYRAPAGTLNTIGRNVWGQNMAGTIRDWIFCIDKNSLRLRCNDAMSGYDLDVICVLQYIKTTDTPKQMN